MLAKSAFLLATSLLATSFVPIEAPQLRLFVGSNVDPVANHVPAAVSRTCCIHTLWAACLLKGVYSIPAFNMEHWFCDWCTSCLFCTSTYAGSTCDPRSGVHLVRDHYAEETTPTHVECV